MTPRRIQLRQGRMLPLRAVKVDRNSKFGNPFMGAGAVEEFRAELARAGGFRPHGRFRFVGLVTVDDIRRELRGRNLACWCPLDRPCHADALLEIANA